MKSIPSALAAILLLGASLAHAEEPISETIDAQIQRDLHYHIAELADDAYEGREPGTPGEDKTIAWLQRHFAALGTQPGNGGSWVQEVPITAVTSAPDAVLSIRGPDFSASVQLQNTLADSLSRNVAALIPGVTHPDEVIIYTAHWDHLGVRPGEEGDNIYNGASDNASGVAGLLAIARQLLAQDTAPERSILFLAVTAEESGLLGSKYYSENPIFPAAKTVANFNMDNIAAGNLGRTRDVAVVGYGNSELENYLARAAEAQGRVVVQEPYPEKGSYYRSDHFSLAQVGIPALYLTNATDSVKHGKAWGDERLKDYTANHYHKPSDEYDPAWDLSGAAQEVMLLLQMGRELAGNRDFPNWHEGVEFKRARDASLQR
jgi:Zn-dependent M28 family amino/carboxypeptidase